MGVWPSKDGHEGVVLDEPIHAFRVRTTLMDKGAIKLFEFEKLQEDLAKIGIGAARFMATTRLKAVRCRPRWKMLCEGVDVATVRGDGNCWWRSLGVLLHRPWLR